VPDEIPSHDNARLIMRNNGWLLNTLFSQAEVHLRPSRAARDGRQDRHRFATARLSAKYLLDLDRACYGFRRKSQCQEYKTAIMSGAPTVLRGGRVGCAKCVGVLKWMN